MYTYVKCTLTGRQLLLHSTAFTFNPQGPPDSDGVGGAGVVAAGTGDPAANAGGAAPFQF